VPSEVRAYYAPWGLPKDEFTDHNHWPRRIYVREARRMVSDVVVTENTLMGKEVPPDSVGLGSYLMDSHAVKYILHPSGVLAADGGLYKKVPAPFPISYRAIIPKGTECVNLLVPVCLSASHAAYGAIRMEPVFMILGQSAAIAAFLAIDLDAALQDVPYEMLKARLLAEKQAIEWKMPSKKKNSDLTL
jgi:hypothetical protein